MVHLKNPISQLVILLLVLMSVVWGVSIYEIDRDKNAQIHNTETATALQAQSFAENTLSNIKRINELLLDLRAEWHGDYAKFSEEVKSHQENISDIAFQIAVIDQAGFLAYSNLAPATDRIYLGDREHFKVHKEGKEDHLFIGNPVKGKVSGKWSIQFTRPIYKNGIFKGVIVASVSPDMFTNFRAKLSLSDNGIISMAHSTGEIMARAPGGDEFYGMVLKGIYNNPDAPVSGNYSRLSQTDGIERVFGYYKLNEYKLTFFVAESSEYLLQSYSRHRLTVLSFAFTISLILIAFFNFLLRDLTKRKQAEQQKQEQQAQLAGLIDSAMDAIVSTNADQNIILFNGAAERLFGYQATDIIGQPLDKLLPSRFRGNHRQLVENFGKTGVTVRTTKIHNLLLRGLRSNGEEFPFEGSVSTNEFGGKKIYTAILRDITERKQAEDLLRASEQKLNSILDSVDAYIYLKDIDGNYLFANKNVRDLWHTEIDDIVGCGDEKFFDAATTENIRHNDRRVLDDGEVVRIEETNLIPVTGETKTYLSTKLPLRRDDGCIYALCGISTDITDRKRVEIELLQSQSELREAQRIARVGSWSLNLATNHVVWSEELYRMQGLDPKTTTPPDYTESAKLFTPESWELLSTSISSTVESGVPYELELEMVKPDSSHGWMLARGEAVRNASNAIVGVHGVAVDITERKRTEAVLRQYKIGLETTHDGFWMVDSRGYLQEANQAYADIVGYTVDELRGMHVSQLEAIEQTKDEVKAHMAKIISQGYDVFETRHCHKDGHEIDFEISVSFEPGSQMFVAFCRDITLRKQAEKQIEHLAFYDPLTGLPNRRLLQDRLTQGLSSGVRRGRKGALLFIDLDNFKTINDTLGHDIGDLLLKQAAQRIQSCLREGDTVARPGGDEFVVMLSDLSEVVIEAAAQTEAIGDKILAALSQPYLLSGHECHNTSSIGATLFGGQKQAIEEIMKQADIAMYQAKKAGRNALRFFDPEMQSSVNSLAVLEDELRVAITKQEFQLYYQIQVDSSGSPLGAEALIRWMHPERGLVSPVQFIPLAEDTGQIIAIGKWVLETACAQLKAWQKDTRTCDLVLAVNVSAKQFRQSAFVLQVQETVTRHSIDPRLLKLELTESMLAENIEETVITMNKLKEIGVRFSLDDFGTGYSSLQYLKRLPLDQVKIDQSFVRDIVTDSNDKTIVRTIIAMAYSLGLDVIAEGVETEAQQQLLLKNGCKHYQGYLFGKPVPIEQFEVVLKKS